MNRIGKSIIALFTALSVSACATISPPPSENKGSKDTPDGDRYYDPIPDPSPSVDVQNPNGDTESWDPIIYSKSDSSGEQVTFKKGTCDNGLIEKILHEDTFSAMKNGLLNTDPVQGNKLEDKIKTYKGERRELLDILFSSCKEGNNELRNFAENLRGAYSFSPAQDIYGNFLGAPIETEDVPFHFKALVVRALELHADAIRDHYPLDNMLEMADFFQEQYIEYNSESIEGAGFYFSEDKLTDIVHELVKSRYKTLVYLSLDDELRSLFGMSSVEGEYYSPLRQLVNEAVSNHVSELVEKNKDNPVLAI